jgi:acyl-CoA hydrolase
LVIAGDDQYPQIDRAFGEAQFGNPGFADHSLRQQSRQDELDFLPGFIAAHAQRVVEPAVFDLDRAFQLLSGFCPPQRANAGTGRAV